MRALQIGAYGGPEQLKIAEVSEPHAGAGEIRIKVVAASINAFDGKVLGGMMSGGKPLTEPVGLGLDAAGVVDEIGEGVDGVRVGDDVFGLGRADAGRVRGADRVGPQARPPWTGASPDPPGPWSRRPPADSICSASVPARPCWSTAPPAESGRWPSRSPELAVPR